MLTHHRSLFLVGVFGPLAFISAWIFGALTTGVAYSSIDDAISRLAAVGADTRWLMTAGFIVFGVALVVFGQLVRREMPGAAWVTATFTGVATLGVAATPLDWTAAVDRLPGVAAGLGYVTLAATSLLGGLAVSIRLLGRGTRHHALEARASERSLTAESCERGLTPYVTI